MNKINHRIQMTQVFGELNKLFMTIYKMAKI